MTRVTPPTRIESLHHRISQRGQMERARALPLAQALFDGGYEPKWGAAVRRAQDIRRWQERRAQRAMGMLPCHKPPARDL